MYDVAEEIRHIVDKEGLKKIYKCLNTVEREFLRVCLHQQEKVVTKRIQLDHWNGDSILLKRILHRRGLSRLGHALASQHKSLQMEVVYTLDSGRGEILKQYLLKQEIKRVAPALILQVVNLINFLNKKASREQ